MTIQSIGSNCERDKSSALGLASNTVVDSVTADAANSALSQLATANPKEFESVMKAVAGKLQAIANNSEGPSQGFLNALASKFKDAAKTDDPSVPRALSANQAGPAAPGAPSGAAGANGAAQAPHGHHHRHLHGVGQASSKNSDDLMAKIIDALNAALANSAATSASTASSVSAAGTVLAPATIATPPQDSTVASTR